jgi:putative NIF3 family GTP cyclohydrolase 1 type 2
MTATRPSRWSFDEVAAAVAAITGAREYAAAEFGILRRATRVVRRLGLALDERDASRGWTDGGDVDAMFVHRPWSLPSDLRPEVGLLFCHRPFDDCLTTGPNVPLAAALGLHAVRTFGERDGRPLAMVGDVDALAAAGVDEVVARIVAEFGGADGELRGDGRAVRRAVVAGAMTDALVREAAALGADLYVTGQLRQPAARAVAETGMHVLAVGHRRSERWGLGALGRALEVALPGLDCVLSDESADAAAAAR